MTTAIDNPPSASHNESIRIALVGDSTVFEYPSVSPMRGWGQVVADYLPANFRLLNEACCGASTKTYPIELWRKILASGVDCILIQFGHNDSHAKGNPESTDPAVEYPQNLRCLVHEAKAANIQPVLVTPVRRRIFKNDRVSSELAPYSDAMKRVAAEFGVPIIDLHASSEVLFNQLGEAGSDAFTINKTDTADRPGADDRTHFTEIGARAIARLVAPELLRICGRLGKAPTGSSSFYV